MKVLQLRREFKAREQLLSLGFCCDFIEQRVEHFLLTRVVMPQQTLEQVLRINQKQHTKLYIIHRPDFRNLLSKQRHKLTQLLVFAGEDIRRAANGRRHSFAIKRQHQYLFVTNVRQQSGVIVIEQLFGAIEIESNQRALMLNEYLVQLPVQF